MTDEKFKLGDKVKDKVTGLEGIATSKTEFMNGCIQIEITPKMNKGDKITVDSLQGISVDIGQIEKIGDGINKPKKKNVKKNNGGPMRIHFRNK